MSDKAYGMLISHAIGDALGALHEFNRSEIFNGYCNRPFTIKSRFKGTKTSAIGQTTDDNTMTLALLKVILNGYSEEMAVKAYIEWASTITMLGKNTSSLFYGIKTTGNYMKTYNSHMEKLLESGPPSQSNGCMMRCSPIALISNKDRRRYIAYTDCKITNPSPNCIFSNILYIEILNSLIYDIQLDVITLIQEINMLLNNKLTQYQRNEIEALFISLWLDSQKDNWKSRVINGEDKGWILHALYCAFVALTYTGSFINLMYDLVQMGGDTDTNMAIAGAVFGARFGYNKLIQDQHFYGNYYLIMNSDWSQSQMIKSSNALLYHPSNIIRIDPNTFNTL